MEKLTVKSRVDKVQTVFDEFYDFEAGDPGAAVTDILTDLRHYCDRHNLKLGELDMQAYCHYAAELAEERCRPGKEKRK